MSPILAACYFNAKREQDGQYDRLARVLTYSAQRHCPTWTIRIEPISPTLQTPCTGNPSHAWNTAKLNWWDDVVQQAPDGTPVVLMDADTVILRPLDPIWALPFDLAYTARALTRLPLNGGVVALRVSDRTKAVMRAWRAVNDEMMREPKRHTPYHVKYAGMNQASFGCLLEEGGLAALQVIKVPCAEWNCCEWQEFSDTTRILHVKSRLRRVMFSPVAVPGDLERPVAIWRRLEAEIHAPVRRPA